MRFTVILADDEPQILEGIRDSVEWEALGFHVVATALNGKELLELTCKVMPVYFLGISIFGIQCACQTSFISLGQAKVSLFIALLRKIILLIPLAVILPKFMGVMGIYRAEPIADVISVLTTSAVFIITVKKVLRNM